MTHKTVCFRVLRFSGDWTRRADVRAGPPIRKDDFTRFTDFTKCYTHATRNNSVSFRKARKVRKPSFPK